MKAIKHNGLEWLNFSTNEMTWHEAREYAELLGFRLPTRKEIKTLSEDGEYPDKERLQKLGFDYKSWVWAIEEYEEDAGLVVCFNSNETIKYDKNLSNYVICVREIEDNFLEEINNKIDNCYTGLTKDADFELGLKTAQDIINRVEK